MSTINPQDLGCFISVWLVIIGFTVVFGIRAWKDGEE